MPTHVYKPLHDPPSTWDRVLVHPLEIAVSLIALLFGVLVFAGGLPGAFIASKSMDQMPLAVAALVAAFLVFGGMLALTGLNWHGEAVSHGWALERFGWLVQAGGFAAYSLSVLVHYPDSIFSWGVPLGLGLGGMLRFWSVVCIERSTRRVIAEVKGALDGNE